MKNYLHPHYINLITNKIKISTTTFTSRIRAHWWKVKLGKNSMFKGQIIFRNLPGSKITIGSNCHFNSSHSSNLIGVYTPCMISTIVRGAQISIGDNCGFSGTVIAAAKKITLGSNVRCGANTLITDTDWHTNDPRTGKDAEVIIEDDVWLGYGVKILKGVTIGKGSLIGAGSVVTKDIPARVIAAGNPCKVIRKITEQ